MASIIVDLSDDIKKLQSLKAEIQEVKKELGSINVNVHLDIKRDMEAKLKSLTSQYDALVKKVSEAEGKVIASTQRINQAAEKIIKAQEQLAKATGVQSGTSANGGAAAAANQAETASVQAQAKAYDELRENIEGTLGSMEGNARLLAETNIRIKAISANIAVINKAIKSQGGIANERQTEQLARYNQELAELRIEAQDARRELSAGIRINIAGEGSLKELQGQLLQMQHAWERLSESARNSQYGRDLSASIELANKKVSELEQSMGRYQRNVGNYASGWNGLSMSIQQIGRELPSLAMGWNTFFLAISNNLPILADEIKRARVEYDNLKNAGQKATPVWKQVVASLVSWQTALTVGITLLTLYGDEIINWVSGLFGADSAQKKLNESLKDFNQTIIQGQAEAKLLFDAVKRTEEGTQGRVEAIRRINNEYGKYLPNLLSERSSLNELDAAYRTVTEAIKEHTAAKMRSQAIEKIAGESIKKQADALTKMRDISKGVLGQERGSAAMDIVQSLTEDFLKAGDSVEEAWRGVSAKLQFDFGARTLPGSFYDTLNDYIESVYDSNKEIASIQERYNPFFNKKEADKAIVQNKEHWEEVKRQAQSVLDSIESTTLEKLRAGNITGIPDAIVEKYKQAQSDIQKANKELAAYDFSQKKSKTQKQVIAPSITVPDEDVDLITPEEIQKDIDHHREMMDKYLADYGDYQQKRLAIADMYALKIAQAETEGERLSLEKQKEEALSALDLENLKNEIDWEQVFGDLDKVSTESLKSVQSKLRDFIDSQKDLQPDSLKEIVYAIESIDDKIAQRNPFDAIAASFRNLKKANDDVRKAQDAYNKALKTGTDEEKKNAKATLANAKDNKQKSLLEATEALHAGSEYMSQYVDAARSIMDIMGQLGVEAPEWMGLYISGVGQVMDGLASIDLTKPMSLVTGGLETVKGALTSILSLGGLWGGGESDPHLTEDLERLTQSNQDLELAINNLADKMEEISVADASDIYAQQKAYLEESMRNTREMMSRSGAAYDKGFLGIGGTHSSNKNINEAMTAEEWKRISDIVGRGVDSASEFWGLTSEEMYNVATNASDLYSKIKQYADDGHKDAAQYMDEYIGYWQEMEELTDAYNEKLTSVSFDSIKDDFRNALLGMEDDTEAFAESFENMMRNAILESMMTQTYDKKLRDWYNSFSSAMEGGELTAQEQKDLKKQWDSIVSQASEEWDAWKDMMGWDSGDTSASSPQQASRGYGITASQESVDETNGRLSGIQMAMEETKSQAKAQTVAITQMKGSIDSLVASAQKGYDIADETRSILAQSYLELQEINENTGAIVQPIKQMQKDIEQVRRNTERL